MVSGCLAALSCGTWTTSSYPEQVQYLYCRTGAAFNWPKHMEKCLCQRLGNIQRVCRSSSWGSTYPQAQSSQPTNYSGPRCPQCSRIIMCFSVRPAQPSTESCLTSTSATLLAAQTSSTNSTDYCEASKRYVLYFRDTMKLFIVSEMIFRGHSRSSVFAVHVTSGMA